MGSSNGRLTSGQMAQLNQVSKKALRVYQQKGLLVPSDVDSETGYQYYSYEQCSTLDIIQQMQGMGFSLAEIKEILDKHDFEYIRQALTKKSEELEKRELELKIAQRAISHLEDTCDLVEHKPVCYQPALVWLKRERIIFFPVEPYHFEPYQAEDNIKLRRWEYALRGIKKDFATLGLTEELFHNIGCVVSKESIEDGDYICTGGFINNDEGFGNADPEYWHEGYHLTVTIDHLFGDGGRHIEHYWLERLVKIADEHGFSIAGDYRSEALVETPAFQYEGRDMMMRLYLPVDIHSYKPAGLPELFEADDPYGDARYAQTRS